jgi:hypothetical protein
LRDLFCDVPVMDIAQRSGIHKIDVTGGQFAKGFLIAGLNVTLEQSCVVHENRFVHSNMPVGILPGQSGAEFSPPLQ